MLCSLNDHKRNTPHHQSEITRVRFNLTSFTYLTFLLLPDVTPSTPSVSPESLYR